MAINPIPELDNLSEVVGSRLATRRTELGLTIRQVADEADISPGHLSDIENGVSQVSLPVLLRVVRSLGLTMTAFLPSLGGRQLRFGGIDNIGPGESVRLSDPHLTLTIDAHRLKARQRIEINLDQGADLMIHVLSGLVSVTSDNETHDLATGDTLDAEFIRHHVVVARRASRILVASGPREA